MATKIGFTQFRKKPVVVEAFQWRGGDHGVLTALLGRNWSRADAVDMPWVHGDTEQVVIFNSIEQVWIPCAVGDWIIRGTKGEFYPCDPEIFAISYESVEKES